MEQPRVLVGKTYFVKTFGCQMNLHDSERVAGVLDSCGCICVDDPDQADIVVFMTCCVREKADQHLYGQASAMVSAPTPPSGRRVVAIGGCIAQRDGEKIREHVACADVVFGTSAIESLPALLADAFSGDGSHAEVDTVEEGRSFSTDLPSHRAQRFHAWVPIMTGCDNFCTYCIVPYVRGREKSRTMESIVSEVEALVAEGVLLRRVGETGIERIRFTSSNPKDLDDEVIRAMAEVPAVMPHLHLAVQSGSSRVLKAMNRKYTREEYLELVERLRTAMPDLALSTDIIVGFPGETEEDFEQTLSLVREANFSSAFTFIYSRRPGTPAAKMPDDTPREVIQERFDRLADLVAEQAHGANQADLGQLVSVLVEGASKRDANIMVGHSEKNRTVHFTVPEGRDPESLVGTICDVRVEEARTWYLRGSIEGEPR